MTSNVNTPRRTLLITPVSPWGRSSGTQQRTALLYAALSALAPVDVLVLAEGSDNSVQPGDRPEILARLSWKQLPFTIYKYGIHEWTDRWCQANLDWSSYELVVGRYLTPMTKVRWPPRIRTIVDCDDAFYWYPPELEGVSGKAVAMVRTYARYLQTRLALRKYDHVFFCSQRDYDLFPAASRSILPNVVHAPAAPEESPAGPTGTALIVGSMWYPPNRQGVDWFLRHCWPAIASARPGLGLRIAGATSPQDRAKWASAPRTAVLGYVDDLTPEYARALFVIAPINYGGGSCTKFIEAAAFSRTCVVTPYVLSAFAEDFRDDEAVILARDAGHMVKRCVDLFDSKARRDAVARRAYDVVARRYPIQRFDDVARKAVVDAAEYRLPGRRGNSSLSTQDRAGEGDAPAGRIKSDIPY